MSNRTKPLLFDATPYLLDVVADVLSVHVIPSSDVTIVFVPVPTATHNPYCESHTIPRPVVNTDVLSVHVIPSGDVDIALVPAPTATHRALLHATPCPDVVSDVLPVHVLPFGDVATVFVPEPVANHNDNREFHAIPYPEPENVVFPLPVHEIPSGDVTIVFVAPSPTATHKDPFHAIPRPRTDNTEVLPVHVIPSGDVAIEFVPAPTATHKDNCGDHATPYPAVENIVFPLLVQV